MNNIQLDLSKLPTHTIGSKTGEYEFIVLDAVSYAFNALNQAPTDFANIPLATQVVTDKNGRESNPRELNMLKGIAMLKRHLAGFIPIGNLGDDLQHLAIELSREYGVPVRLDVATLYPDVNRHEWLTDFASAVFAQAVDLPHLFRQLPTLSDYLSYFTGYMHLLPEWKQEVFKVDEADTLYRGWLLSETGFRGLPPLYAKYTAQIAALPSDYVYSGIKAANKNPSLTL